MTEKALDAIEEGRWPETKELEDGLLASADWLERKYLGILRIDRAVERMRSAAARLRAIPEGERTKAHETRWARLTVEVGQMVLDNKPRLVRAMGEALLGDMARIEKLIPVHTPEEPE